MRKRFFNLIVVISLSCLFQISNAQIVYTDVDPDQGASCSGTNCSNSLSVDFNNDGTDDFKFIASAIPINGKVSVNGLNESKAELFPLEFGDTIQNDFDWSGTELLLRTVTYNWYDHHICYGGPWESGDHYLACKLAWDGKSFYGWIRLSVSTSYYSNTAHCSFSIRDYAYDTIPDEIIFAGETCPAQTLIVASGSTVFCSGASALLTVSLPAITYQWKKDAIDIGGATLQNYSANESGNYSCSATYNCGSLLSNDIAVTVNPKPKAKITADGCEAGFVTLTCTATPNSGVTYTWKRDGTKINGAINPTYVASESGTYLCGVKIISTGCSTVSKKIPVSIDCKLSEEFADNMELAFPNPFSTSTTISFSLPLQGSPHGQSENISLKIYDLQGRLIRTLADEKMSEGKNVLTWDARDENGNEVSGGIYLLQLSTLEFSITKQLSVVK